MSGYRISIPGYRLNKAGKLVPDVRRLSVSRANRMWCNRPTGHPSW